MKTTIEQEIRNAGLIVTPVRVLLLKTLRSAGKPLSVEQVAERLLSAPDTPGRASLFRNLDAFVRTGLAERLRFNVRTSLYLACSRNVEDHHHHIVCTICKRMLPVDICLNRKTLQTVESTTLFRITGHTLQLFGTCASCDATQSMQKKPQTRRGNRGT
ncbi:MAG: transcriptional repressor [bacterium]|nr:transcriptional repressor [bacterium]